MGSDGSGIMPAMRRAVRRGEVQGLPVAGGDRQAVRKTLEENMERFVCSKPHFSLLGTVSRGVLWCLDHYRLECRESNIL